MDFARGRIWLFAVFVSGFCLLALEVVWFRLLLLYVAGFSISLAVMLAVVLGGLALGGLAGGYWHSRSESADRYLVVVAFVAGLGVIGTYALLPYFAAGLAVRHAFNIREVLSIGFPLMFPVSFTSGVFFTLAGSALLRDARSDTAATGSLTLANTIGAALGSLVAAFAMLPNLGIETSVLVLALAYGGIGLVLLKQSAGVGQGSLRPALASCGVFVTALALFPYGHMESRHLQTTVDRWSRGSETKVAAIREGVGETVIYLERLDLGRHHSFRMLTNGVSMSGTSSDSRRYMKLYAYLPVAIHPNPKQALLISYGVGSTAKALTDSRGLEGIDVVDISRDVLAAGTVVYSEPGTHPLEDPRVQVHVEDGRYFLQTTDKRFDIITGEPPPPRIAGVVNLYTREYFDLMKSRLTPGGMVTYWLPIHSIAENATLSILRSFCEVFDDCTLWHGNRDDLMMVGTQDAQQKVTDEHFSAQWDDPVVRAELDRLGFETPAQLGALFIGGADYLAEITRDSLPLVDDYPKRVLAGYEFTQQGRGFKLPVEWRRTEANRIRFLESEFVRRVWPDSYREAALAYFPAQELINTVLARKHVDLDTDVASLQSVLTQTSLAMPVLRAVGSDSDIQRIIASLPEGMRKNPGLAMQLGALALSQRRYEDAAQHFAAAERVSAPAYVFPLRTLAMCLAGESEAARELLLSRRDQVGAHPYGTAFWRFLDAQYEVLPVALAVNRN